MNGFSEDASRAVQQNPEYFMAWYTLKSLALVVAIGAVCYYVGKEHGRDE